jgi:hypothetical protein
MPSSALVVNYSIPKQSEHGAVQSPAPLRHIIVHDSEASLAVPDPPGVLSIRSPRFLFDLSR